MTARVDVTYPYKHVWYAARGAGARSGTEATLARTVRMDLREVPESDAPVAFRLATTDGNGITYRTLDGRLMRPVRRPGSWEPCSLEDLREACQGGSEWMDSPVLREDGALCQPRSVASVVAEPGEAPRRWGDSDEAEVMTRVSRAFDGMVLIGGVAHMPAATPVLVIKNEHVVRVSWRSPDCDGSQGMSFGYWQTGRNLFDRDDASPRMPGFSVVSFPLDREADARAFARPWAERWGQAEGEEHRVVLELAPGVPVRGGLMDPVRAMLAEVRATFADDNWIGFHKQPRAVLERWMDLRDVAMSRTPPDGAKAMWALDTFAELSRIHRGDRMQDTYVKAARIVTRWELVERGRDLAQAPDVERADDESVAAARL